jgi:hypothetical protein
MAKSKRSDLFSDTKMPIQYKEEFLKPAVSIKESIILSLPNIG